MFRQKWIRSGLAVLAGLALVASACTTPDDVAATTSAPPTSSGPPAITSATGAAASATGPRDPRPVLSTLTDAVPGFDMDAVAWEGYWYSRYNLGNLVMMSGLGLTFAPPMEGVLAMVGAVDHGPEEGEHVTLPTNPALLRAVYAGGLPEFANAFNGDPGDLANFRWVADAIDTRLLPAAQAQTILKEVEWAKLFNNGGWAGDPAEAIGAMDRFKGMVMFASAKTQAAFALENLRDESGLFVAVAEADDEGTVTVVDDTIVVADQYQMLQALADLVIVLRDPASYNDVYSDAAYLGMLGPELDAMFDAVAVLEPQTILDHDLGAQAMAWYAAATTDEARRAVALERLDSFGDALAGMPRLSLRDHARAIRGLLESARVLGDTAHLDTALADFTVLRSAYDPERGAFEGLTRLTTWDVGDLLGALNSLRFNTGDAAVRRSAEEVLVGFFESAVDKGGLMRAVVPKEIEASPFEIERLPNDLYFAYPGIPLPGDAGGPHGSAAVDVAAISFEPATGWTVSDRGFVTASTMHGSNEMFWIWGFQSGFPTVPGAPGMGSETGEGSGAEGVVIEVVASEFTFDPGELALAPGTVVTIRLVNDGAILHNITIPEFDVFVEAVAGQSVDTTFTVPAAQSTFFWFCSVPGHRDAGMEGEGSVGA